MTEAVQIKLALDNKQLSADLAKANAKISNFTKKAGTDFEKLGYSVGEGMKKGLSVALAGITALGVALVTTSKAVADLNDAALQLGVSFQDFQTLRFAAIKAGVGVDKLTASFGKMEVAIGKAFETGKAEAFEDLNLNIKELINLSPDEQFVEIAKALSAIENPAQRAAAAAAIFGKGARELNPLLDTAAGGMESMTAEADKFGVRISDLSRDEMAEFDDNLETLKLQSLRLMVDGLTPLVSYLNNEFASGMSGGSDVMKTLGGWAVDLANHVKKLAVDFAWLVNVAGQVNKLEPAQLFGGGSDEAKLAAANIKSFTAEHDAMIASLDKGAERAKRPILPVQMPPPPPPARVTGVSDEDEAAAAKAAKAAQKSDEADIKRAQEKADKIKQILLDAGQAVADAESKLKTFDETEGSDAAVEALERRIDLKKELASMSEGMNPEQIAALEDMLTKELEINEALEARRVTRDADHDAFMEDFDESQKATADWLEQDAQRADQTKQMWANVGMAIGDAMGEVITGSESAKESLKGLLEMLLKAIAQAAIMAAFGQGSFGSNLGGIFGGGGGGKSGAGGSTVRIYNYGAQVGGIQSQTLPNGDVDVIIGRMASAVSRGGNPFDQALRRTYNLGRNGK